MTVIPIHGDAARTARIPLRDETVPAKHRRVGHIHWVSVVIRPRMHSSHRESLAVVRERHRACERPVALTLSDAFPNLRPGFVALAPPVRLDVPGVGVDIRDANRDCPAVAGYARSSRRVPREGVAHLAPPPGAEVQSIRSRETRARRHHETRAVVGQRDGGAETLVVVHASEILPKLNPLAAAPLVHPNQPSLGVVPGDVVLLDGRHRHARAVHGQRHVVAHRTVHVAEKIFAANREPRSLPRVVPVDGHVSVRVGMTRLGVAWVRANGGMTFTRRLVVLAPDESHTLGRAVAVPLAHQLTILRADDDAVTGGGHVQRTERRDVRSNLRRPSAVAEFVHASDGSL